MKAFFAAAVGAVLTFAVPAIAQEAKQDFTLINKTGYELKEIYVGPTKSDDWGNDIMGDNTVPDGSSVNVHFQPKVQTCKWDLKVVYTVDSSKAIWYDIDLCTVDKITIRYDKDKDKTSATFD